MRCTRRWLWLLALALAPVVPGTARANDTCASCSGNLVSCVEDARAEKLVCREECKASRHGGAKCMRGCRKSGAADRKACRQAANTCAGNCLPPDDPTCNPGGCSRDLEDCMHDAARSLPACLDTCPKGKGRKACVKECQALGQSGRDFCSEANRNCLGNCSGSTTTTTMAGCSTTTSSSTSTTCNTTSTTSTIPSTCGNGRMDPGEECDGNLFCNAKCPGGSPDGGFTDGSPGGGFLVCTPQCTIDFSHCPGVTTSTLPGGTTSTSLPGGTTSTSLPGGSTTTTIVGGTTSTTIGGGGSVLSFTTGAPGGTCGTVNDGGPGGAQLKALTCGGLNTGAGSGATSVPEGPTPGGSETQFNVSGGAVRTLSARTAAQTGSANNCSATGCKFGTWLPIAGTLSTCVQNTFSAPASGTLDGTTGELTAGVALSSAVFLTNNVTQPCPLCVGGTCDATWKDSSNVPSPNAGDPCTSTDAVGHNYDCAPPGVPTGTIPVDLTPLTTGTASATADASNHFCPAQTVTGAFGEVAADYIEENGSPAGPVSATPAAVTLASVFCIPATGNAGIDVIAGLPGPGATSLPGTLVLLP